MNIYKNWSNLTLFLSMLLLLVGVLLLQKEWALIFQFNIIQIKSCKMEFILIIDWISMIFSSAVLFISSMVIMFSEEYMENETFKTRFLTLILMFILSMLLLVTSPNMMSILLGWDGLGLVSYALVIYYQNPRSYNAGMLTVLSNRIGDVLILMSIAFILSEGTWNIIILNFNLTSNTIFLLILLAAMTKSAQIPFSAWLPAAMAAPTPVSALVHSSTLVTAGVFLLIRFHNMFTSHPISILLLTSSSITMFLAGIGATLETDMKKIIALSTLSQLGVMMMSLSLNLWTLTYFHMITHAMFKALLFLCAGYVIHNTKNNQDIRKMGLLIFPSPMISTAMLTSSLALMGFPFLAGFYSKDLILEHSMKSLFSLFLLMFILVSFGMTMMYSIRLPYLSLISNSNLSKSILIQESALMKTSIFSLSTMAITTGAMMSWMILPSPPTIVIHPLSKLTGIILILVGFLLSSSVWIMNSSMNQSKTTKKFFLGSMWFLPVLSTFPFLKTLTKINKIKLSEMGWSELLGAQGIHHSISKNSNLLSNSQNNSLQMFTILSLITVILIVSLYSL